MTQSTIETLRSHWDDICEGDLPPFRSDIAPRTMPNVLDTLFILEQLNPEDTRVRIAGLKICEMMGMEVRGQSPMSFFQDNARGRFDSILTEVLGQPKIAKLGLDTVDKLGNKDHVDMILLPLRSDFGDISRIIGCVTVPDSGFTAPIRYYISSVDTENPFKGKPTDRQGFAESAAGFSMEGAPTLRSIDGNTALKPRKRTEKPNWIKLVD